MGCVEPIELFPSLQMFFSVIKPPVCANWHPPISKVRLLPFPQRLAKAGAIFLADYISKGRLLPPNL